MKELYNIPDSGWKSAAWNWGSALGTGHDCAMICRQQYATPAARAELIENLLLADPNTSPRLPENFEEVKLVLALAWQKERKRPPMGSQLEAYGQILDEMAKAQRYEDGDDEICSKLLVQDMQKRYVFLDPEIDEKIAMNTLWYEAESDYDLARRRCCGLVLKSMNFVERGL